MNCPIDILLEWFVETERIGQRVDEAQRQAIEAARGH
jgi:hypothetical protein